MVSCEAAAGLASPVIPDHEVERLIARGPLATVYRARRGGQAVAIKVYPPSLAQQAAGERIRRERMAQREVSHPAVARLLDWGLLDDGSAFLASQWIEGTRLEERMAQGPMPWTALSPIVAAIGEGLGAIHAAGIVHRDIKPANILLPARGSSAAVILDFGHALVLGDERLTDRGLVVGSAAYMAPEQAAGRVLDGRADLYALGVMLYRALTGVLPFESTQAADLLRQHQTEPVVPPRRRAPAVAIPAAAEDLCLWLLAKSPDARLPSPRVLALTLRAIAQPKMST